MKSTEQGTKKDASRGLTEQELTEILNAPHIDLILVTDNTCNPGELKYRALPADEIDRGNHTVHARVRVALLQRTGFTSVIAFQITADASFSIMDDTHLASLLSDYFNSEQALRSQAIALTFPIMAQLATTNYTLRRLLGYLSSQSPDKISIEIKPFVRRANATRDELTRPFPSLTFSATAT